MQAESGVAPGTPFEEAELSAEQGIRSADWFLKDMWGVIKKSPSLEALTMNSDEFEIPAANSAFLVKGTILMQQALLERERLEVATLKLKAGTTTPAVAAAAQQRYTAARDLLCTFLKTARKDD